MSAAEKKTPIDRYELPVFLINATAFIGVKRLFHLNTPYVWRLLENGV